MFEPRIYRAMMLPQGLVAFRVVDGESDLQIHATRDLRDVAAATVRRLRDDLSGYLASHPRFGESFVPVEVDGSAPEIVRRMAAAAAHAGVGPMASVAGAFAEAVARELAHESPEVIVENGGDVYLMGDSERIVRLWAGAQGPAICLKLRAETLPAAVATSSATIGPSVSLGRADAATVVARDGALADAAASVVGNRVRTAGDLEAALVAGRAIEGVRGVVAVVDGHIAAWGDFELVPCPDA